MNLTLLAGAPPAARGASRLAYCFEGMPPPASFGGPPEQGRPARPCRNPIALALAWRKLLDDEGGMSRAGLARRLGVSRARVTQVLGLLELAPETVDAVAGLGDPLPGPIVTERMLGRLRTLPSAGQLHAAVAITR